MLHGSTASEEYKGLLIDFDHAIFLPKPPSTVHMNTVLVNNTNRKEAINKEEGISHQPTIPFEGPPMERTVGLFFSSWSTAEVL